jgi:hypothetical protein
MYKIIGADGREYGPVSADQLRQWIVQGRADAATRVLPEGAIEWQSLGSIPEFSLLLPPPPGAFVPGANPRKTNTLALASLILGALSLTVGLCCCFGIPFNVLGLILAIIALVEIQNHPELYTGRPLAVIGLILCALSILLAMAMLASGQRSIKWTERGGQTQRL